MSRRWMAMAGVVAAGLLAACHPPGPGPAPTSGGGGSLPRFPDFGQLPPPSAFTPERVFRLSQDYPVTKPVIEPAVRKILAIDFTRDWKAYAAATLAYILEGNIENRAMQDTFFLEDNPVRRWYHVPWQQWGDDGREGLHGLTAEGPVLPHVLSPAQNGTWQTYAVGFYNAPGGYEIGRVWADPNNPRIDAVARDGGFPVGTVVAKLLFTTTPVSEAPFLSNPIEWTAYVKPQLSLPGPTGLPINPRRLATVRLIQVDMMVRDDRAKATGGWVFGTWVYNGRLSPPVTPGQTFDNRWKNLVPVGLMWGNDPTVNSYAWGNPAPTRTLTNPDLKQTVINTGADLPPMHLGYGMRLSGPVDNTLSSCKSCHSAAQYPAISSILPAFAKTEGRFLKCSDPQWMRWFRNLGPTEPFDPGATAMDNSLQLAGAIQNYLTARDIREGGVTPTQNSPGLGAYYAVQFWKGQPVQSIYALRGAKPPDSAPCNKAS